MNDKKGDGKQNYKRLFKSRKDRIIDGVCGGFAEYLAVDVTLVRVVWAISIFVGGIGVIAYLLALFIIPINSDHINLKETKKRKGNTNIVWGILLIALGLILLSDWVVMPFHWDFPMSFHWWNLSLRMFWPLLLISLGCIYIVYILNKAKDKDEKKQEGKVRPAKGGSERRLYRNTTNKTIAGVCGGIGLYFDIDPTIIRIVFAVLAFMTNILLWIIVYIIMILVVQEEPVK
jgi:phage shock protein C